MCKTAAALGARQLVVAVEAVTDHIAGIVSKKADRVLTASGLAVVVQHDISSAALRTAVYPHAGLRFRAASNLAKYLYYRLVGMDDIA